MYIYVYIYITLQPKVIYVLVAADCISGHYYCFVCHADAVATFDSHHINSCHHILPLTFPFDTAAGSHSLHIVTHETDRTSWYICTAVSSGLEVFQGCTAIVLHIQHATGLNFVNRACWSMKNT